MVDSTSTKDTDFRGSAETGRVYELGATYGAAAAAAGASSGVACRTSNVHSCVYTRPASNILGMLRWGRESPLGCCRGHETVALRSRGV